MIIWYKTIFIFTYLEVLDLRSHIHRDPSLSPNAIQSPFHAMEVIVDKED